MDGHRFDDLTRRLVSTGTSRRGFFGVVAAVGAGLLGTNASGAACPPGQYAGSGNRCLCRTTGRAPVNGVCPCGAGQTGCGGVCKDLSSDLANCGSCGYACPSASTVGACAGAPLCRAGTCVYPPLPAGTVCRAAVDVCDVTEVCDGTSLACPPDVKAQAGTACNDGDACTQTDRCDGNGHCVGSNPVLCPICQRCSSGACAADAGQDGTTCGDDGNVCTQTVCRGGQCVNEAQVGKPCDDGDLCTLNDACDANGQCHGTPAVCPVCQHCRNGNCVGNDNGSPSPFPDQVCCGGIACQVGQVCDAGVCKDGPCRAVGARCSAGSQCCNRACIGGFCVCSPMVPLPAVGGPCTEDANCCDGFCLGIDGAGVCTCLQIGTPCAHESQCCSGNCNKTPFGDQRFCSPFD